MTDQLPLTFEFICPYQSLTAQLPSRVLKDETFLYYQQNINIFQHATFSNLEQDVIYEDIQIIADKSGYHVRSGSYILQRRYYNSQLNRMYLFGIISALLNENIQNLRIGVGSKLIHQYFSEVFPKIVNEKRYSPLNKNIKNPIANPEIVLQIIKLMNNRSIIFYHIEAKSKLSEQQLLFGEFSGPFWYDQYYEQIYLINLIKNQKVPPQPVNYMDQAELNLQFIVQENQPITEPVQKSTIVTDPQEIQQTLQPSQSQNCGQQEENKQDLLIQSEAEDLVSEYQEPQFPDKNILTVSGSMQEITQLLLFLQDKIGQNSIQISKIYTK
ncbi:hypothetical protein SS50377_22283 [Spironucleus salmonicida]|uniref:Uncharacterized protein n=1 Tax=Spironucleus salmonicida TaxID=348837 RepID=V6LDB3_9EUKA|nr:hypothetical protein SS50377_22283 [Spironucleus salmonicida]|eukprot:EST42223.1 Hypothetical protein SS50377_18525 [Spironucleus salmonicida]